MKKLSFLLMPALLLLSCNDDAENDTPATNDTTTIAEDALKLAGEMSTEGTDSLCFMSLQDAKRKDTLTVRLYIKGEGVTGDMAYRYYQKDSRIGTLVGTKKGRRISAMWTYMQEGITDSLKVYFKLKDNVLHQMEPGYDPNQDQDDLPHDKQYKQVYEQVECK